MTSHPSKRSIAGLPIAAGGFGCVFKPALKCKNSPPGLDRKNGISKLMLMQYANEEIAETNNIKPILESIPGYENYFLVQNITICTPATLTGDDLLGFNTKCENLTTRGFNESNVNKNLNKLKSLDIPYGGIDIDHWLLLKPLTANRFNKLNVALINLLYNGIIPANRQNLFHCDVKGGNILIDNKYKARLIDWGLAGIYTGPASIQSMKFNRVLQYNIPFTNILLDGRFQTLYTRAFHADNIDLNSDIVLEQLKIIAINYIYYYIDNIGRGHYSSIKVIINDMLGPLLHMDNTRKKLVVDYTLSIDIIASYLATALKDYTIIDSSGATFDTTRYFTEVFSHNVDVWGFLMTYIDIFIPTLIINMGSVSRVNIFKNALRNIIIKYCYSPLYAARPIPIDQLIMELSQLSVIAGHSTPAITKYVHLSPHSSSKNNLVVKKKAKKTKKLVLVKGNGYSRHSAFTWTGKRCPRGTRRNKKTNKCERV